MSRRLHGVLSVVAIVAVVALLAGLGSLAFSAQRASARIAERVHHDDRVQLQQTLAGLTHQYLLLSLGELDTLAERPGWTLTANAPADRTRLAGYVQSSPLIQAGAQVVSLTGKPLTTSTSAGVTLPSAGDPGFGALRAGLLSGQPGVSTIMAAGGHELLALGLPISRDGVPAAVLVGYVDVGTWPLQSYVSNLAVGDDATTSVLDASGTVIASSQAGDIGHRLPGLPPAPDHVAIQRYTAAGAATVASRGPVGLAGWNVLTSQPAAVYDGAFVHQRDVAQLSLLGLLLAAGLLVVGVFVARYRRVTAEARRATFDPLTGLAQRRLLLERLEAALARSSRSQAPLTVFYGDLDGFKAVNDTHGHRRGDALLVEVAHRLQLAVREQDLVARLGGDEFVVVAEDIASLTEVAELAERIAATVSRPVELDRGTVAVGVSLGAIRATHGDVAAVLEAADTAMYDAKHSGARFVVRDLGVLAEVHDGPSAGRDDRPAPATLA